MDLNTCALKELHEVLKGSFSNVKLFRDLEALKQVNVVITATSTPRAIVAEQHIKPGMIFIDAAQPKNISEDIAKNRKDVIVIDSGIAHVPHMKCGMAMGPNKNEVYACLGEAMILAWHSRASGYAVGKVRVADVHELSGLAEKAGFRLAAFRNAAGYISDMDLKLFREKYAPATSRSK